MTTYPIFKLADDTFVEWSSVVDAPVSATMTRAEALASGIDPDRLDRAERNNHSYLNRGPRTVDDLVIPNRAGPRESCLTVAAIIDRYRPRSDSEAPFELTPDKIEPYTTGFAVGPDDPEYGIVYWVPWQPGHAPATITADTDLHAMVRADS